MCSEIFIIKTLSLHEALLTLFTVLDHTNYKLIKTPPTTLILPFHSGPCPRPSLVIRVF